VRLGPVGVREIEALLDELAAADAPRAARLARIAAGRPGLALVYARAPEAEATRAEIARRLLDLLLGDAATTLAAARDLLARSLDLARALEAGSASTSRPARGQGSRRAASKGAAIPAAPREAVPSGPVGAVPETGESQQDEAPDAGDDPPAAGRLPAHDRRRGALGLVRIWQDVARDLAVVSLGQAARVRDIGLLDDLEAAAARLLPDRRAHPGVFLSRLSRATELLEGNASPELVIDVLVLAWRLERAAARSA
jgi:hypothetical protein